jgi:hypothetical protein
MNIRIIINSLILIFIIHIIILNINYSYDIGNKKSIENFSDDKTVSFLMDNINSNNNKNDDFKEKMMKYIQQDYEVPKENKFETKNVYPVEASNTYLSDNNVPNFESNVADTKKFYTINYDNLDETNLKSTSINNLKNYESLSKDNKEVNNKEKDNITISSNYDKPCHIKEHGRESIELPDTWNYKNELPMNGGTMNGIYGFDSLESQFALYNPNKLNLQSSEKNNFDNIPHNDLRKPIIYEN